MSVPTASTWWHIARGRGARWGVVVLWVLGAVLSYSALRDLAVMLGFSDTLANLWPLVIDLAVWVGSMNALEAGEQHRRAIEQYAWVLVALYSVATVAGNALVSSAEPVDPRMIRALGGAWAYTVAVIAHAAPALTWRNSSGQSLLTATATITSTSATAASTSPTRGTMSNSGISIGACSGAASRAPAGSVIATSTIGRGGS